MNTTGFKHFDILAARQAYAEGRNVTQVLRDQLGVDRNTSEIIELAYDLQAGTYIENAQNNRQQLVRYVEEMAAVIGRHIEPGDSLLDIGTGETTTLSELVPRLSGKPRHVFACDISWSRLYKGLAYARQVMSDDYARLVPFVADISELALQDKSIDLCISSHALEPNGGKLEPLLAELFRVTARTLILFEPCYELNSREGQQRMERLGYIRGMASTVEALGATLVEQVEIKHVANPLNPTVGFVITPPGGQRASGAHGLERFSVPGTNLPLTLRDGVRFNRDTGLCFFELQSIPVLTSRAAMLASALAD